MRNLPSAVVLLYEAQPSSQSHLDNSTSIINFVTSMICLVVAVVTVLGGYRQLKKYQTADWHTLDVEKTQLVTFRGLM